MFVSARDPSCQSNVKAARNPYRSFIFVASKTMDNGGTIVFAIIKDVVHVFECALSATMQVQRQSNLLCKKDMFLKDVSLFVLWRKVSFIVQSTFANGNDAAASFFRIDKHVHLFEMFARIEMFGIVRMTSNGHISFAIIVLLRCNMNKIFVPFARSI